MDKKTHRGKRKDNGEWVYGHFYESNISGCYILSPKLVVRNKRDGSVVTQDTFDLYEIIPETVGQCTGLPDKNGKAIFEGDIVEMERGWGEKVKYTIEYDPAICAFIGDAVNYIGFTTFENDGDRIKIIGNIHDNPEILEGA